MGTILNGILFGLGLAAAGAVLGLIIGGTYLLANYLSFKKARCKPEQEQEEINKKLLERANELMRQSKERLDKIKHNKEELGMHHVEGLDYGDYFLEVKNGEVIAMYDIDLKRVPLAFLGKSRLARTVGIDPSIYYLGYKIRPWKMRMDEAEIRNAESRSNETTA